jgi:hypothetical protein
MAAHSGKSGAVYVGAVAVAEIKDWSLEESGGVVTSTTMSDEWVKNVATQKSWTSSFNAFWDLSASNGQNDLGVGSSITLNLYPDGNTSTNTYWSGNCIITSVSKSASFDGLIEASFSVTGNGALTEGTVGA